MKSTYNVLAFRQQEKSPIQITFVAHAGDILQWSGIPRKSDELLTGYQRFRDPKRVDQEIVPYFQNPKNCSPTAVIVALRKDTGVGSCSLNPSSIKTGEIIQAVLTIEIDDQLLVGDAVFEAALDFVNKRLPETEPDEAAEDESIEDEEIVEDDQSNIHLGSATLRQMKALLEDKANWANPSFRLAILDYVKPAFLIDGQHRTSAAAKIGQNGLPFMVCGLFDAPWEEQVFQFTVVNLKQNPIPPSLITSIAALSLTRQEQNEVEARLRQAGVRMQEVTIMSLAAYDDRSPFAGMIDMAVGDPKKKGEKLGYGGMRRIASVWYSASRTSLTQIANNLYGTTSSTSARQKWRTDGAWFDFFCAFWDTIRETYDPQIWKKGASQLMIGAHLWALQEVILEQADGQVDSHWHLPKVTPDELAQTFEARKESLIGKLKEVIATTIKYFPEDMWTIKWSKTSQDTGPGREELANFFQNFIDKGKKGGGLWKGWKSADWFKAK
ncbi:hypothetical protein F0U62_29455 [Cystobacter fuscus]|uniref:hypothetical protein n=1 Tax=Cystobacter fuscus TaxID=43 RepID=UPI002B27FFC8|nr:hypothetical protein F0U62_29455 [Cystobacter fuscus]